MNVPTPARLRVAVDATNPGQFFACCGLLELANRMVPGAVGRFEDRGFVVESGPSLPELVGQISVAPLTQIDPEEATASPLQLGPPFNLRLDWWRSDDRTASDLKLWAGTMDCARIARAMQHAMKAAAFASENLLDVCVVAFDPDDATKKVEPFYFDARRGPNAHSRDVGFAPNDLGMTTIASPAVELLCLIGLQRCQPVPTNERRIFDYFLWTRPIPPSLLPAAVAGLLPGPGHTGYRFESWFRTGQRKHKAFLTAKPVSDSR